MASRLVFLLAFASLLLFSLLSAHILSAAASGVVDDDEDLSFLEEPETEAVSDHNYSEAELSDNEGDELENYDDFDPSSFDHGEGEDELADFDEKDVFVLTDGNFTDFVEDNKYVMVEFYAPWCGHCKAMAPEYAAAATELKAVDVKLAKVDATLENELAEKYEVQGFPTVYFFVDGEHKPYSGQRSKEAIVTWIKKKTGPGISNITTTEEAERVLTSENKVVLGFLDTLVTLPKGSILLNGYFFATWARSTCGKKVSINVKQGPESQELAAASKLEDDVNFYQTSNLNVAKMFHLEADVKRPALVLLKNEAEKVTHFDGQFQKSAIAEFVSANKLPLVTIFSRESASLIFESQIKKQLLLFSSSKDSKKVIPIFEQAAKLFKGKIIFVSVEVDNEETGKPVANYFGVTGDSPKVLGYTADDARKYVLDEEFTFENIKAFGQSFFEDKLKPFFKSDPIPENNDGDVKVVVGNNFDDIVLDESKDVLLEIYAPWCGHCQALEPTYNKLAKHLHGVESLVVAKMDGTTNEHHKAKSDGFPTILFFPAGKKSLDPIPVETERTVVSLYKFLKKHASIPFKLQKPISSPASGDSNAKEDIKSSTSNVKDEL